MYWRQQISLISSYICQFRAVLTGLMCLPYLSWFKKFNQLGGGGGVTQSAPSLSSAPENTIIQYNTRNAQLHVLIENSILTLHEPFEIKVNPIINKQTNQNINSTYRKHKLITPWLNTTKHLNCKNHLFKETALPALKHSYFLWLYHNNLSDCKLSDKKPTLQTANRPKGFQRFLQLTHWSFH